MSRQRRSVQPGEHSADASIEFGTRCYRQVAATSEIVSHLLDDRLILHINEGCGFCPVVPRSLLAAMLGRDLLQGLVLSLTSLAVLREIGLEQGCAHGTDGHWDVVEER
ncbi:hypothetical protein ASR50_35190 [Streptomyces sp. 4F]|nr:hypothetical protein ASR50_00245 [Streptomyces sp. 4F]ALV54135.1 hypothetical protein ASR50_35190 [Streptomyces sp. 4F]